jgi:acetyl esterase/lipase
VILNRRIATVIICLQFCVVLRAQDNQPVQQQGIDYVYQQKESIKSKMLRASMRLHGYKNRLEKTMRNGTFNHTPASLPESLTTNFNVTEAQVNGRSVWTIAPKTGATGTVILFIHGGAYITSVLSFQWTLLEDIAKRTNATIVVPDYPVAPENTYEQAHVFIELVYQQLLGKTSAGKIIIMGDSAGGGLALAFAEKLHSEGEQQPAQLILLSPWLDVTLSNPGITAADKNDPMLGVKGLQLAGQAYAGKQDPKYYLISPI